MAPTQRKRVDAGTTTSLTRARDGSGFTRCGECNKDVPVVLIDMHSCSLDSRIKMHLEAQVVETEIRKKARAAPKKRKAVSSENSVKKGKYKDPNMPKRPLSAYFLFMEDFRKEYKLSNPDSKGVTGVTKEGGARWKSLSVQEKQVYLDRVVERKAEYEKAMEKYKAENKEKSDEEEVQEISDEEDNDYEENKDEEETEDNKDKDDEEENKDDEQEVEDDKEEKEETEGGEEEQLEQEEEKKSRRKRSLKRIGRN